MIISEIFYAAKCNRCGEVHEDGAHSFWSDAGTATEQATESDWAYENGKHYCPGCHEVNEEGAINVYAEYPRHLKTLNGFIEKIVRGKTLVFENEPDYFLIKCSFYNKPRLDLYEVEYIKSLLGDRFISLDYEEGRYSSVTCLIKFKKGVVHTQTTPAIT